MRAFAKGFLAYGVWGLIGLAFLGWELTGWRTLRPLLGLSDAIREHVTLSELVWALERRFPATKYVVLAVMADLAAHFFAGTSLWLV